MTEYFLKIPTNSFVKWQIPLRINLQIRDPTSFGTLPHGQIQHKIPSELQHQSPHEQNSQHQNQGRHHKRAVLLGVLILRVQMVALLFLRRVFTVLGQSTDRYHQAPEVKGRHDHQHPKKLANIELSHTPAQPKTVVIVFGNTRPALGAVLDPVALSFVAFFAVPEFRFLPSRFLFCRIRRMRFALSRLETNICSLPSRIMFSSSLSMTIFWYDADFFSLFPSWSDS